MNFSYVTGVTSKQARVVDRQIFYDLIQSPTVRQLVQAYREGDTKAKGKLPAFLFHATFEGEQRGDQYAHPSGLYILDFDHLSEQPSMVWEKMQEAMGEQMPDLLAHERMAQLGIMMVHVTPSGQGLRVVAKMKEGHPDFIHISQWQVWLYSQLTRVGELWPLDKCVKDFSRLSFVVPHEDFLYLDDSLFTDEAEVVLENPLYGKASNSEVTKGAPFSVAAATPGAVAAGATSDAGSDAPSGEAAAQGAGITLQTLRPELITDYLPRHPYTPSGRHHWWIGWGCYLKKKGITAEALPQYVELMKSQLLLHKVLLADDPLLRNPVEVRDALQWAYDHTEAEVKEEVGQAEAEEVANEDAAYGITEADRELEYNGTRLSEIAEAWIVAKGTPREGETYSFYYDMAKMFRYICNYNPRALYAQLPAFGHTAVERWKLCSLAANRTGASKIPYPFYKFLIDHGYKKKDEPTESNEESTPLAVEVSAPLPKLPPLIREFCDVAPPDFREPLIFALFPVLGTLATRLRACYLDGEEHSPSATSVIYAPQSSGKSFVRRIDRTLLSRLRDRDKAAQVKEQLYKKELAVKKNAKELPEDPQVLFRIIEAVISVPQLCSRQLAAQGLHQLTLLEELDTLSKSNKGGSWADKSDLYRVAYDNGYYGQDYKNAATFSGSVRLYYNLLICGTPNQVTRFFSDAENGLVSRICFCPIKNQQFTDLQPWKPFNDKQQAVIKKISDRLDALTYGEGDVVNEVTFTEMSWLFPPLRQWLRDKLKEAEKSINVAMDTFRKRAAVNAFRYALVCTQLYARLDKNAKQVITDFALWFAERDLQNRLALFEDKFEYSENGSSGVKQRNIYDALPEKFTSEDVRKTATALGVRSHPDLIIHLWKKNNHIIKTDKLYVKITK